MFGRCPIQYSQLRGTFLRLSNGQKQTESSQHFIVSGHHPRADGYVGYSRGPVARGEMTSRGDYWLRRGCPLSTEVQLLVCAGSVQKHTVIPEGWRLVMAENIIPKVSCFLVGLGIGSVVGILFCPEIRRRNPGIHSKEN